MRALPHTGIKNSIDGHMAAIRLALEEVHMQNEIAARHSATNPFSQLTPGQEISRARLYEAVDEAVDTDRY